MSVLVDEGQERPPAPGFVGDALILEEHADRLRVRARSNGAAFLTVLEGAMPGWRAWIDGRSVPVERANALFIGVEVPGGEHVVEFRLLPWTAIAGVLLTVLSTIFLIYALSRG